MCVFVRVYYDDVACPEAPVVTSGRLGGATGGATCGVPIVPLVGRAGTVPRGGMPGAWPTPDVPSCGAALRRVRAALAPRAFCSCLFYVVVVVGNI